MGGDEVATGWSSCTLGELGHWSGGGTPSKANSAFWTGGTIPWVSPKDMKADRIRSAEDMITEAAVCGSAAKHIPGGSILMVTRSGILSHTFPVAINDCDVTVNQDLKTLTPAEGVEASYIAWFLRSNNHRVLAECSKHGTTVASIDTDRLKRLSVSLAPTNEQQRIVDKIETLFAELDKGEEALREVQKLLARYRQSVMKAAVTGALTADWRAANGAQQETGNDLLARILKQRRDNWRGRGKYKEPVKPDTDALPELPQGWVWTSLEALADHYSNAIIDGPFGSKLKTEHYRDEGVRVIRLENIGDGKFRDKRTFVSAEHADELERHSIRGGDIAIASLGDELPRACIIPLSIEKAIVKADCIRFSPYRACVDGTFVLTWLNSWLLRHRVGTEIRGVGRPRLNLKDIRAFPVPLPSFAEQREVTDRVISAEARIAASISWTRTELYRSAALRQSILKDAFSGTLVPQDPSDEPAEKLLERIRSSKRAKPEKTSKPQEALA